MKHMSNRVAILLALMEEEKRPDPSEAVIVACQAALRSMPDFSEYAKTHIELAVQHDS